MLGYADGLLPLLMKWIGDSGDFIAHRYAWVPGHWVSARPGYVYAPSRWHQREDGWYMEPARWDRDRNGIPDRYERHGYLAIRMGKRRVPRTAR